MNNHLIRLLKQDFAQDVEWEEVINLIKADSAQERDKLVRENTELKAHINVLREAALKLVSVMIDNKPRFDIIEQDKALDRLMKVTYDTPAQNINDDVVIFDKKSLQAHDDEVIEKCARAAEPEDSYQDDWFKAKVRASEQIRALKTEVSKLACQP